MEFIAVDVETANPDLASICQLGAVRFEDGRVVETLDELIDPEDYFDFVNVSIHGIRADDVKGAPTFAALDHRLRALLSGKIVVCHTHFDRVALSRAAEKYALPEIPCTWLDTARVARRAWRERSRSGFGLPNLAAALDIEYQAHDAAEDARAAGEVLLRAAAETGLGVDEWLERVKRPITPSRTASESIARGGNPDGALAGETVVFTGALTISRLAAAALAAEAGCSVAERVNKETTLLVVGDQDVRVLAGHEKSAKHRKAESLVAAGQAIRILRESDFRRLLEGAAVEPTIE